MGKLWLVLGGLLAALGVTLGAFHAHGLDRYLAKQGLDEVVVANRLDQCEVAVRYQMYHALGLLIVGILSRPRASGGMAASGLLLLLGTVLFSGGLYAMVFTGQSGHWSIVPGGGLLLIIGWVAFAVAVLVPSTTSTESECS